jgi:hypothetical protein
MEAGRELDALVAEKVMGHIPMTVRQACGISLADREDDEVVIGIAPGVPPTYAYLNDLPRYSTDIAAAWEVVARIIVLGFRHPLVRYDNDRPEGRERWTAAIIKPDGKGGARGDAFTAPHAICLAALNAVGNPI